MVRGSLVLLTVVDKLLDQEVTLLHFILGVVDVLGDVRATTLGLEFGTSRRRRTKLFAQGVCERIRFLQSIFHVFWHNELGFGRFCSPCPVYPHHRHRP